MKRAKAQGYERFISLITTLKEGGSPPPGLGFSLWQATNAWQRAVRSALAPAGLTYVQLVLLAGLDTLIDGGEKVNQAALAKSLGADKMMTSQVLRTLEAAGLVRRFASESDTRMRLLDLTPLGRDRLRQALPRLNEAEIRFFQVLGRKGDRFSKSLRRLLEPSGRGV